MSQLFTPYALGPVTLPNRRLRPCAATAEDGNATDWHLMHLGQMGHPALACCWCHRR
jgi:2,4-dienoyl-CoA reductase-like NADH-dependent reductase (Old Yellow Enzyme family)